MHTRLTPVEELSKVQLADWRVRQRGRGPGAR